MRKPKCWLCGSEIGANEHYYLVMAQILDERLDDLFVVVRG